MNNASTYPLQVNKAYPSLSVSADLKAEADDFQVFEQLGFDLSGEGEHLCLYIRKTQLTTQALISDIARALKLKNRDIGYSGLKDKQAVTEQWISIPWPIAKALPEELGGPSWRVLESKRHTRKLKRGIHKANRFKLRLTHLQGDVASLEARLRQIKHDGVPNYFGEQRFGFGGSNVRKAESVFNGEFKCKPAKRSIYYSAARSYLFNQYLSLRVAEHNWHRALTGDVYNLEGSRSFFGPAEIDETLKQRLQAHDIHPVGPLLGRGDIPQQDEALALITTITESYPLLYNGLVNAGVDIAQRPLRVTPDDMQWQLEDDVCELSFSLPPGSYATAVVHELLNVNESVW